jgi:hypothetical protein
MDFAAASTSKLESHDTILNFPYRPRVSTVSLDIAIPFVMPNHTVQIARMGECPRRATAAL